ncbi:Aste57867_9402 [Aphanomyces stellatus]|uniref:Aste57867_9402 protein n=1 Tax=Aphanomyces stellatus TaxID=120398 RepID=A0A485KMY8_9STRA|nr:hypothetical protein As57867_009366 [Aphanomyces stellatus]VFT86282.1 Aste57867_9402 [Aphanomyces stellatus]
MYVVLSNRWQGVADQSKQLKSFYPASPELSGQPGAAIIGLRSSTRARGASMSTTVFVRNLAYGTTQQQLEELFGDIGPVKKVSVIKDKGRAKTDMTTRGFAFVKFAMEADAQAAMDKLNNTDYLGRKLCIDIAQEKKGPKPLAHQKQPVAPVEKSQQHAEEAKPDVMDEPTKAAKKEKKAKAESVEPVDEQVELTESKKSKKKKMYTKEGDDEEDVVEEEVVDKKKKKAKKAAKEDEDIVVEEEVVDKKKKKAKKAAKDAPLEEEPIKVEEHVTASKKDKKQKKRKLSEDVEDEPVKKEAKVEPKKQVVVKDEVKQEDDPNHVQSERNARRRQHRELLRKMNERKEVTASSEEKSIAIYGLGAEVTEKALRIKMKKVGDATKIEWKEDIVNGASQHVAYVEWATVANKLKALEKLDQHVFKGHTMTVRGLESTTTGLSQKDGVRLIVRNLQFDVKDADLDKLFGKHGPLAEVRVVRLPVDAAAASADDGKVNLGRSRGFGFVQFKNKVDAQQAIEALNNFKLKGREMVVDYAVAKSEYVKAQAAAPVDNVKEGESGDDYVKEEGDDIVEGEDAPELGEDENTLEMEDDGEEADDADEDDDEEEEEEEKPTKPKVDTESQMQRTVFIRNLSFQTTEEALAEAFTTEFGPVEYARVVMDRGSGLSKGVAFVRFRTKDAADAAIARGSIDEKDDKKKKKSNVSGGLFYNNAMMDGDGIYVDGRLLSVTRSVAKDDATRLAEENSAKRKAVDKRNMYLAYEGTINVNKVAETELELPKMDIEKRRRAVKEKKEKLKNPLFFISPTRLSVRNIALGVDEKTLKTVFREAAIAGLQEHLVDMKEVKVDYQLKKGLPVKIILAKIVRDTENLKAGEEPRSRGYGFVEFSTHVHALAALRKLNNNPAFTQYSGRGVKPARGVADKDKTRLIIEFALENHGKLKLREKRMNDAKKRRDEDRMLRKAQGEDVDAKVERKSRGKRQREAKAERAKEPVAAATPSDEPVAKKQKVAKPAAPKPKTKPAKKDKVAVPLQSRKQRKGDRAQKEEKSFDDMVNSYKKKLFATVEDSESRGRWFE